MEKPFTATGDKEGAKRELDAQDKAFFDKFGISDDARERALMAYGHFLGTIEELGGGGPAKELKNHHPAAKRIFVLGFACRDGMSA